MPEPLPDLSPPRVTVRAHPLVTTALLLLGLALYVYLQHLGAGRKGHTDFDPVAWSVIAASAAIAVVLQVATGIGTRINALAVPLARHRRLTTLAITFLAALILLASALYERRDFFPRNHDEHMYLIQARMLARFKLWLPQHALADFFETFHVLVKPKYASIYFPGASLLYVPSIWLGVPTWVESLLICGLIVGLAYRVTAELIDDPSGSLAAAMILCLPRFRQFSLMIMSHTVVLLLGLLMMWAYLNWRKRATAPRLAAPPEGSGAWMYAALLGLFTGWAAITRPIDALAFAVPIGLAFLLDLRGAPHALRYLVIAALAALPMVSLQLVADYGITGHVLKLPASIYAERYWPELGMGYHPYQPDRVPPTPLQQFHRYYAEFIQPRVRDHVPSRAWHVFATERFPMTFITDLPSKSLAILLPLGLFALTTRPRRAMAFGYPIFLALYTPFLFFLPHYTIPIVPAVVLIVLLGRRRLSDSFPRVTSIISVGTALAILAFSAVAITLPSSRPLTTFNTLRDVREKLSKIPGRAVVLFHYDPADDYIQEPVYNVDAADIDDARVVRAHDLGPRNNELFAYYRARQPDRTFYRYDRTSHTLTRIDPSAEATK